MIATLEKQLGALWTNNVRSAWVETFKVVAATMKEGAASVPPPAWPPEAATSAVQRTWKAVEEQGLEANGVLLFKGDF